MSEIKVESLHGTNIRAEAGRFEMEFVNRAGEHITISMPLALAVELDRVFIELNKTGTGKKGRPELLEVVTTFSVGHSNEEPDVLLRANDSPAYAFPLADAKKLWRLVREHAETVERRPQRKKH